ncbi:MAG: tetratricopeptide repeat protein [Acidobacteriota bacterium]|nr:tetratricopeptide repeat protein [Acidobacteriota bacterium]
MKRAFTMSSALFLLALSLLGGACRSSKGDLDDARTQRRFGVSMAKMNLWREAMFRFRRATEIDPKNAMAHNNLAVAYEATGDFDAAAREYREALRLDRSNQYIQKNYSRFVEFTQKGKKRQPKPATAAKPANPTSNAPAPATAASPAPAAPALPPSTMPNAGDAAPNPPTTTNPPEEGSR